MHTLIGIIELSNHYSVNIQSHMIKVALSQKILENFSIANNEYSKSLSWAENLNKLFNVLGGKFKFSAQDSDLEYLCWQWKNSPVSSDLKPPLAWSFFNKIRAVGLLCNKNVWLENISTHCATGKFLVSAGNWLECSPSHES